jgi:hypothetical protein
VAVLLVPPRAAPRMLRAQRDAFRVGYCSGWAILDAAVEQQRADAAFPVSNHADFDDLFAVVRAAAPKRVTVTHGDDAATFARLLAEAGFAAEVLERAGIDAAVVDA